MANEIASMRQQRGRQNATVTSLKRGSSPQKLNDDEIEKRRRRQSFRDDRRRRLSLLSPPKPAMITNMAVAVQEPVPVTKLPSVEVMNKHFEEWMKIAADNKINASNSWDLALIDYFHDMKILKDGDSINFQKASCTLDGCVKIYSSRVDSVATETGKLLSGLTENKTRSRSRNLDDGDETEDGAQASSKKRSIRKSATLEKDINNLNVKKFDLEFSVDPLFRKTCADFDEGGAKGLLLNHLGINENGMIIFDASDAIEDEDVDFDVDDDALDEDKDNENIIDISTLKDKFLSNPDIITEFNICPALKDFEFSSKSVSKTMLALQRINEENLKAAEEEIKNIDYEDDDDDIEEIFPNDSNPLLNDDLDIIDIPNEDNNEIVDNINYILDNTTKEIEKMKIENNDEIKNFDENCVELYKNNYDSVEDDGINIFSYFDSAMVKNWAGPSHWKLRPIKQKQNNNNSFNIDTNEKLLKPEQSVSTPTSTVSTSAKKSNRTVTIDFINGEDISEEELFKPATNIPNLNNSNVKKNNFLLPEDSHFSSRDFLKLFLKPNVIIKFKRENDNNEEEQIQENNDDFVDQSFWADHKDDAPIFEETNATTLGRAENENVGILDNTTYFFNDDDDDFNDDFNEVDNNEGVEESTIKNSLKDALSDIDMGSYGEQLVAKPKKIKSLAINYARSAKRVDVKKLKDNIWKELAGEKEEEEDKDKDKEVNNADEMNEETEEVDKIQRDFKFSEVVGGLKNMYQEKNIKDISVAFCFICLLHLANEKDLEIISDGSLSELTITQNN